MAPSRPESLPPMGRWEFVTHTFPATANTDSAVKHRLPAGRYREVHYMPVRLSHAATLYTGTKSPEPGVVYLRSTGASTEATLLLFLPQTADA